jgi:[ribosomal protein S18]-alanine N-acetyltransferase
MTSPLHTPVCFTRLTAEHIPVLLPIELEAYPDPWTQGLFRQEIENGASHFYVVSIEGTIVGYVGFWLILDEAHVTKITVDKSHRGLGLGSCAMRFLIRRAEQMGAVVMSLEVRESNESALNLYGKLGFRTTGLRKGYYASSNEAALIMAKTLSPALIDEA